MELEIHVIHYLVISTIMMFCGIYGFFTRKNLLALLISVELMLNATNINFAVFNRYFYPGALLHPLCPSLPAEPSLLPESDLL